jgi:hypothetical protein
VLLLTLHSLTSILITEAGQTFAHFPHPTHLFSSIMAKLPLKILTASSGHTAAQQPQATQALWSIVTFFFALFKMYYLLQSMPVLYQTPN